MRITLFRVFVFAISIFSAKAQDNKAERQIDMYRSVLELEDLKFSHEPGIYPNAILLSITGNTNTYIFELLGEKISRVFTDTISITKPSYLRIRKRNNQNSATYVGYYLSNIQHRLPVVALVVEDSAFFPPNGIYEGTVEAADGAEETAGGERTVCIKGKAWEKTAITTCAQVCVKEKLFDEFTPDLKTSCGMTLGLKHKAIPLSRTQ